MDDVLLTRTIDVAFVMTTIYLSFYCCFLFCSSISLGLVSNLAGGAALFKHDKTFDIPFNAFL